MGFEMEQIRDCTLYCSDAREVLPTLGHVDAVVTDPPYGISFDYTKSRRRRKRLVWGPPRSSAVSRDHWTANIIGDDMPFDVTPWLAFPQVILWGGHLFAQKLPVSKTWLIWDKRNGQSSDNHGDCELAWTNLTGPIRIHRQIWRGIVRSGEENTVNGPKLHPAQKPLALMRWCVEKTTGIVLDPFMGSGTTGVACIQLGRTFIGIEINEKYFRIACRRIEEAYAQPDLFVQPPASIAAKQEVLL